METRYIVAGKSLKLDESTCIGCGLCVEVCPHAVFVMESSLSRIAFRGRCMECGACARNCPTGALEVKAGVGCAAAVIGGLLRGGEASCDCGPSCCGDSPKCC